jgi:Peptidase family M1 domain
MRIAIDLSRDRVDGRLRVHFTPDFATDRLIFRLWPNGPRLSQAGARLEVGQVTIDGERAPIVRPGPTTLQVMLEDRLRAGDSVIAALPWTLRLPGAVHDRISRNGNSLRLGSFFPLLAWDPGRGWVTDPPSRTLAETSTSPVADFDVRLHLPDGLQALATGRASGNRWRATAVRDFALAVGRFRTATGVARAPARVDVTVGVDAELDEDPTIYRDDVIRALEAVARLYGPYPWPSFNLALSPNLDGSGIEYPTFVMQGADSEGLVTTHEVAHMWFYSLVGSNPAREPWLDEGLTTYAQARVDGRVEDFASAAIPAAVRNRLGEGMRFWDRHQDEYFRGAYLQGVKALAAIGPTGAVDCGLRDYVRRHAYGIADSGDLVANLEKRIPRAGRVLERFGVNP